MYGSNCSGSGYPVDSMLKSAGCSKLEEDIKMKKDTDIKISIDLHPIRNRFDGSLRVVR